MTHWLVSRHLGAIEWIQQQGIKVDQQVEHLDTKQVKAGDLIIGTLPVQLVAAINTLGANYLHLCVNMPENLRGKELTSQDLNQLGARLKAYKVTAT